MAIKNAKQALRHCALFTATLLMLNACSSNKHQMAGEISDPLEETNRVVLKMNNNADKLILEPIAKSYRAITPQGARTVTSNFLRNLNSPVVIGNEILQGDAKGAGNATARAIINTLAGFGGLLDLAEEGGIPHEQEDFGQTLAVWGIQKDVYLMLPFFGPSSARDLTGRIVDSYADPLRMYLSNTDQNHLQYQRMGAEAISKREELIEVIDDLRRNSFDYYAAIRSAYHQHRQSLIADGESAAYAEYDDF